MRRKELPLFLQYIIRKYREFRERGVPPSEWRLPPLHKISEQLGSSVPNLREQLAVARAMGFVDAKPKVGIHLRPYSFHPPVSLSLQVAVAMDRHHFDQFLDLRRRLEKAYFLEAVQTLTEEDKRELVRLVEEAKRKLSEDPVRIPHREHRDLHLIVYRRLNNPFVRGLLEAFWDAYEAVGLSRYRNLEYLRTLWGHHERMVNAIMEGDYQAAHQALVQHLGMLETREEQPQTPVPVGSGLWEDEF